MKLRKYVSGLMNVCFVVPLEDAKALIDNGIEEFDGFMLINTATGTTVPVEIMTLDMDELVMLGDDEDSDVKLA